MNSRNGPAYKDTDYISPIIKIGNEGFTEYYCYYYSYCYCYGHKQRPRRPYRCRC